MRRFTEEKGSRFIVIVCFVALFALGGMIFFTPPDALASYYNQDCEEDGLSETASRFFHSHCYEDVDTDTDTDTDTHAKRKKWGVGLGLELEWCGTDDDSWDCPGNIDEVRTDPGYDFLRKEGIVWNKVQYKAKNVPGAVGGLFQFAWKVLWVPGWFSQ